MQQEIHFWDMDHTVLNSDCDVSWKQFAIDRGLAPPEIMDTVDLYYQQYLDGVLDIDVFCDFQFAEYKGHTLEHVRAMCQDHYDNYVRPHIYREARARIDAQREAGALLCLITATNRMIAEPVAAALGFEHLLATELEMVDGRFTAKRFGEYCIGPGKLPYMTRFCEAHGGSMANATYYGDSGNDIAIMQGIGHGIACNPSDSLRAAAEKEGWPIWEFDGEEG
jgi:HAD superfamily hydrolase (TIGR01490 family)